MISKKLLSGRDGTAESPTCNSDGLNVKPAAPGLGGPRTTSSPVDMSTLGGGTVYVAILKFVLTISLRALNCKYSTFTVLYPNT